MVRACARILCLVFAVGACISIAPAYATINYTRSQSGGSALVATGGQKSFTYVAAAWDKGSGVVVDASRGMGGFNERASIRATPTALQVDYKGGNSFMGSYATCALDQKSVYKAAGFGYGSTAVNVVSNHEPGNTFDYGLINTPVGGLRLGIENGSGVIDWNVPESSQEDVEESDSASPVLEPGDPMTDQETPVLDTPELERGDIMTPNEMELEPGKTEAVVPSYSSRIFGNSARDTEPRGGTFADKISTISKRAGVPDLKNALNPKSTTTQSNLMRSSMTVTKTPVEQNCAKGSWTTVGTHVSTLSVNSVDQDGTIHWSVTDVATGRENKYYTAPGTASTPDSKDAVAIANGQYQDTGDSDTNSSSGNSRSSDSGPAGGFTDQEISNGADGAKDNGNGTTTISYGTHEETRDNDPTDETDTNPTGYSD